MKRWLCVWLCVALMLTGINVVVTADDDVHVYEDECGLVYEVGPNNEATIISYNADKIDEMLYLDNLFSYGRVTGIAPGAFAGCDTLREVKIIGITEIGEGAFANCEQLEVFQWWNTYGLESYGCHTKIPARMFENCSSLECVLAPGFAEIGEGAFEGCTSLSMLCDKVCTNTRNITVHENNEELENVTFGCYYKWTSDYLVGDVNGDFKVNLIDAFKVYAWASKGETHPCHPCIADANRDGKLNIVDAYLVYEVNRSGGVG